MRGAFHKYLLNFEIQARETFAFTWKRHVSDSGKLLAHTGILLAFSPLFLPAYISGTLLLPRVTYATLLKTGRPVKPGEINRAVEAYFIRDESVLMYDHDFYLLYELSVVRISEVIGVSPFSGRVKCFVRGVSHNRKIGN